MWFYQKNLFNILSSVFVGKKYELFPVLEEELRKSQEFFDGVLKDKPSSAEERESVLKAKSEPIQLQVFGVKMSRTLEAALIEEALILSEIFGLNERSCVELLLEAEEQTQYFHGLNRGLTAILLFYDSKKMAVNSLKTLVMARRGRTWAFDESLPADVTQFSTEFVDELLRNGLVKKILARIEQYDWIKTEEKLLKVNGIGSLKHRRDVRALFEEVKQGLAECVFGAACQKAFDADSLISLVNYLKKSVGVANEPVHLQLLMAALFCFDSTFLENRAELDLTHTFISEEGISAVYRELAKTDYEEWATPGIKAVLQFGFYVFLCALYAESESGDLPVGQVSAFVEDQRLLDLSLEKRVFAFLSSGVVQHERFHAEKYFVERVHNLLTDFIYRLPEKIIDLKIRNEEVFKFAEDASFQNDSFFQQSRLANVQVCRDFEDLLNLLGELYSKDPLRLELSLHFWTAESESTGTDPAKYQRPSQKQISLYKFVRYFLSGDTPSSSLYIAYINLLAGLSSGEQSAQHCFVFLQANSHFYDSNGAKISLNHIFTVFEKYHEFFRSNDQLNPQAQQSLAGLMKGPKYGINKAISQNELQGLISVCRLVAQMARFNEKIRTFLFEFQYGDSFGPNGGFSIGAEPTIAHQACTFPALMFGLLAFPIPTSLKGEICKLLSALALNPQTAKNMWHVLESSQMLQTGAQVFNKSDIKIELEEVESREETYPFLRGFLQLIKTLVSQSMPPENLGIGLRAKDSPIGFQPYLQFLTKNVYLKIFYRPYKNALEKWEIAAELLEIFHQILSNYEVQLEAKASTHSSPGYQLLAEFTHDSPAARTLFLILNDALVHLLEYNARNEPLVETASLTSLKILGKVLDKQSRFIELLKGANLNAENVGVEKLVIMINPKTNKADYLLQLFRFVQLNLAKHAYYALNIISALSEYKLFSSQMLNLLLKSLSSTAEQSEIVAAFVQIVESEEEVCQEDVNLSTFRSALVEIEEVEGGSETMSDEQCRSLSQLNALRLLLFYIRQSSPNLGHLLLGVDIQKPLKDHVFHSAGTRVNAPLGSLLNSKENETLVVPRNCLHSIIRILSKFLKEPSVWLSIRSSIELSYELLFSLSQCAAFNQRLLYFLRSEHDLIYKHLRQAPFKPADVAAKASIDPKSIETGLCTLNSWVLNLVCVELQNLVANKAKVQMKKLVQLLVESSESKFSVDTSRRFRLNVEARDDSPATANKIFSFLSMVSFSQTLPEPLELNFFDQHMIEKVIDSCKHRPKFAPANTKLYDIRLIKNVLQTEIRDSNINSSRLNLVDELKFILQSVFERNELHLQLLAKKKLFESLKTLIEALLLLCPFDLFAPNQRYSFLVSLVERLFQKMSAENVYAELTYQVANVLFTIAKNLRDILGQLERSSSDANFLGQKQSFYFSSVCEIFDKMLAYVLNPALSSVNVRTYLYASLINFLAVFSECKEDPVGKRLSVESAGLLKLVCSDSCEGLLNLSTMCGYSIMNRLLEHDHEHKWLRCIDDNGFLACVLNSLANTDNQLLEELFHSELSNDKVIYIFESKMALLIRAAKSPMGAQLLLKNDLIGKLSLCSVFEQRKKFERNMQNTQYAYFALQLLHQFYKIFLPTLELLLSVVNSLGHENVQAKFEVAKFVLKFSDSFVQVLTSRQCDMKMLKELRLVTTLLSKLTPFDELIFDQTDSYLVVEQNSALSRIKKECLGLLNVYLVPEQMRLVSKVVEKAAAGQTASKTISSQMFAISLSLASFFTSGMKGRELSWSSVIFDSTIEAGGMAGSLYNVGTKSLNLGLLIHFIKFCVDNLERNVEQMMDLEAKQGNVSDLVEIEKKQIVGDYKLFERLSEVEKNGYLKSNIAQAIKTSREDIKTNKFLIEKLLLLLWRHLEFFFVNYSGGSKFTAERDLKKDKFTFEDFAKFRQNLNAALTSSLLKRLQEVDEKCAVSDKCSNFVSILVKRMQRLLHLYSSSS